MYKYGTNYFHNFSCKTDEVNFLIKFPSCNWGPLCHVGLRQMIVLVSPSERLFGHLGPLERLGPDNCYDPCTSSWPIGDLRALFDPMGPSSRKSIPSKVIEVL